MLEDSDRRSRSLYGQLLTITALIDEGKGAPEHFVFTFEDPAPDALGFSCAATFRGLPLAAIRGVNPVDAVGNCVEVMKKFEEASRKNGKFLGWA
jgi:hypothetical protein